MAVLVFLNQAHLSDIVVPGDLSCVKIKKNTFSDGEFRFEDIPEIDGEEVFVLASGEMPIENLFEIYALLQELSDRKPKKIILILTYLPFSRQDKRVSPDGSCLSGVVIKMLASTNISQVVLVNVHDKSCIDSFVKMGIEAEELNILPDLLSKALLEIGEGALLVAPDKGSVSMVQSCAQQFDIDYVEVMKTRLSNEVVQHVLSPNVRQSVVNRKIILIDDIVDTAGTVVSLANILFDAGAESVSVVAAHPILSGKAAQNVCDSHISKIFTSTSVSVNPVTTVKLGRKLVQYSLSDQISALISRLCI